MKAPSALDIGIVVTVMTMAQVFLSTIPAASWWWAPAASAALLAGLKVIQVNWPKPEPPPGAASMAAIEFTKQQNETKMRKFLVD